MRLQGADGSRRWKGAKIAEIPFSKVSAEGLTESIAVETSYYFAPGDS